MTPLLEQQGKGIESSPCFILGNILSVGLEESIFYSSRVVTTNSFSPSN